ncbi:hypothetical protein B0H11DRAFT_2242352 [Mycena galericulata]|nr:hypothetical protein B0H11DRAFT_2242352 [Mycena galericulata]
MALTPTNMTREEMIPDTENPDHDSRYWCLPPIRDTPNERRGGTFAMYLVGQGKIVGVWHNWTVAKSMVDGFPQGAQSGHQTRGGCVQEWQEHCVLGVHPHPVDPRRAGSAAASSSASLTQTPRRGTGRRIDPSLQEDLQKYCMPILSPPSPPPSRIQIDSDGPTSAATLSSASSESSITITGEIPPSARYYAIWGGDVVFTSRSEARSAFEDEEAEGNKPRLLSTENYEKALAFAEAVYWI